jgi:hypothetical protein
MMLELPQLVPTRCVLLSAYAELEENDPRLDRYGDEPLLRIATVDVEGGRLYVQLEIVKKQRQVRIDVANARILSDQPDAEPDKFQEICGYLQEFRDVQIKLESDALFEVKQSELPGMIRSTLVETTVQDVSLKMTGGTITVTGAPVHRMQWWLFETASARIRLFASAQAVISEHYLRETFSLLNNAFIALVLGRRA